MDRLKSDSGGFIEVTKVAKVECQGEKISSTCIRERLLKGNVEELPAFLGRPYEVKCDWDGFSFNLNTYYTLPAPGRYCSYVETRHAINTVRDDCYGRSRRSFTKKYDKDPSIYERENIDCMASSHP